MVPEIVNPLSTPWPKKTPLNLRVCQVKSRRDFRRWNWVWVSLSDLINEINYAFQIGMETWIGVSRVSTWVRRTRRRMKTTTLHQFTSKEIRINQIKERWGILKNIWNKEFHLNIVYIVRRLPTRQKGLQYILRSDVDIVLANVYCYCLRAEQSDHQEEEELQQLVVNCAGRL